MNLTNRIFRSICFAGVVVLISSLVLIMGVLYDYFSRTQMKQMAIQTQLAANAVEIGGIEYLEGLDASEYRITWVDADGTVKYDSEASSGEMANHLEREEIREALENGTGESSRYSATLMERMLYSARKLSDGTVIRVSSTQLTWLTLLLGVLQPIIVTVFIAFLLSLYLAFRLSKKIVKPLNDLKLDDLKPNNSYEELSPIIERISSQQNLLALQASELRQKKDEFETATKNMSEGIILLNENGAVISVNDAASRILNISRYCVGKDLLLFNNTIELQELLHKAGNGEHSEMTMRIGDANYQLNASPVISDNGVSGIALIIFDITEKEKAERARREFTANVSHELKTPLQSIMGRAELLSNGMVKQEDIQLFAKQIFTETKRMIVLIDDTIKLSRLDEGSADMRKEETDVYELAKSTVKSIAPFAEEAGITLTLEGTKSCINGIPLLISAIIFNLCDNAIKYNKRGGSVAVSVVDTKNTVKLSVSDTGIGIPEEQQNRIFERFYRVDKSRSKEVGGTGLGLSIVKHASRLHNAEIEIKSVVDKGTSVSVTFPK